MEESARMCKGVAQMTMPDMNLLFNYSSSRNGNAITPSLNNPYCALPNALYFSSCSDVVCLPRQEIIVYPVE